MFDFDAFWHASLLESAGDERAVFFLFSFLAMERRAFVRQRGCSNYLPLFCLFFFLLLCSFTARCCYAWLNHANPTNPNHSLKKKAHPTNVLLRLSQCEAMMCCTFRCYISKIFVVQRLKIFSLRILCTQFGLQRIFSCCNTLVKAENCANCWRMWAPWHLSCMSLQLLASGEESGNKNFIIQPPSKPISWEALDQPSGLQIASLQVCS